MNDREPSDPGIGPLTTCNLGGYVGDGDGDGDDGCEQSQEVYSGSLTVRTCADSSILADARTVSGDVLVMLGESWVDDFYLPRCVKEIGDGDIGGALTVRDSPILRRFWTDWRLEVLDDVDIEMGQHGNESGAHISARVINGSLAFSGAGLWGRAETIGNSLVIFDAMVVSIPTLQTASKVLLTSAPLEELNFFYLAQVESMELDLSTSPLTEVSLPRLTEAGTLSISGSHTSVISLPMLATFDQLTIRGAEGLTHVGLPALEAGGVLLVEGTGACTSTLESTFDQAVNDGRLSTYTLVDNADC